MTTDPRGHCDHHTVLNEPGNGGNPHLFAWLSDRYARFRRAMADLRALLDALGPPIFPPIGPSVVVAHKAAHKAASEAEEAFAGWQVTTRDGSEIPAARAPNPSLIRPREPLAYNPRKGWYRLGGPAWPGLRYGPYSSADHAISGFDPVLFNLRSVRWTTDQSSSK